MDVEAATGLFTSMSLSARRAWIEICPGRIWSTAFAVALRKESVDRNITTITTCIVLKVALRKESVDRNYIIKITETAPRRSLSARRAWIEILVYLALIRYLVSRSPQGERG